MLPRTRSEHIEGFLNQIAYGQLRDGVAEVVKSIEQQYRERGYISDRQYDVLRRCSIATCGNQYRNGGNWSRYYHTCRG